MAKFVVIDGNSIMNRAFYGLSGKNMLMNKKGLPTNALFGFLTILFKILNEDKPDFLTVAFDLKAPTFRHKMYDGYKAQRKGMPEELAAQMPVIKDILDAMNISRVELEGYEADDILGTLSLQARDKDIDVILFTGDRDSFQLVDKKVHVKLPVTKGGKTETEIYDETKIYEKYGVVPRLLIDVKGLMGDTSDNIPGVPGIGEKTALSYIKKFNTIESLYENIDDDIVKPKAKEALLNNRDLAFLSRTLATINREVPITFDEEIYRVKEFNSGKLYEIFNELEFSAFIKKLDLIGESGSEISEFEPVTGEKIEDLSVLEKLESFAFFTYNESSYQIGIYSDMGTFCIDVTDDLTLKKVFESNSCKYGIYTKNLYIDLKNKGINLKNLVFDLDIAEYVVDPVRVSGSVEKLALTKFDFDINSILDKGENQITFFETESKKDNNKYVCSIAKMIWILKDQYLDEIKKNEQEYLFNEIEMPLVEVLADMQIAGMKVDSSLLRGYGVELKDKIDLLTKEIINLAECDFNINSPKQLGEILFEKLNLPAPKKTKTGYATDADTLDKLIGEHPIIEKILEYKQLIKIKSTYVDGLEAVINKVTSRIHSNFNQTVTATGRLSSTEPNLQNIPVKMEAGKKIRKMFVPEEGYVYIDADYSQIELRVLAHMAQDKVMLDAFNNDEDIHTETASQIFGVDSTDVTPILRSRAKAVNFGIVYGQGDYSLGQDLRISRKEAKEYIDSYFEHFRGIREFQNNSISLAKEKGYVTTIFNRRRYLPEINSSNFNVRSFGERIAMNMPIQGTAADIIKIAMILVNNKLKGKDARLILQVHDELIVEAKREIADEIRELLCECMESAIKLSVSLKVEANIGTSWLEAK